MKRKTSILSAKYEFQSSVFCIISDQRVYRSKSPDMFSRIIRRAGINGAYVPFMVEAENIGRAVESLRVLNIAGANVSVPFKEKVIPFLDILSEGANIIGAVNTIVCHKNQLKGYNTNAIGFMDALNDAGFDIAGKRALVVGTGGAARAAIFILNWLRAENVLVAGRDFSKAEHVAQNLGGDAVALEDLCSHALNVDLVVNATSVSSGDECADLCGISRGLRLDGCKMVFDINYGRTDNFWKELALRQDAFFMDGLSALAYQARRTFLLWTGQEVRHHEFLTALEL